MLILSLSTSVTHQEEKRVASIYRRKLWRKSKFDREGTTAIRVSGTEQKNFLNVCLLLFFPIVIILVHSTAIVGLNYWQILSNNLTLIPSLSPILNPPSLFLKC